MGFIKWILVVTSASLVCGCHHQNSSADFQKQHYFYSNIQGNNTIEGEHIFIKTIKKDTIVFYNEIGDLLNSINKRWILGQGSGKPYYDTGKEYLWRIKEVIAEKNQLSFINQNQFNSIYLLFFGNLDLFLFCFQIHFNQVGDFLKSITIQQIAIIPHIFINATPQQLIFIWQQAKMD